MNIGVGALHGSLTTGPSAQTLFGRPPLDPKPALLHLSGEARIQVALAGARHLFAGLGNVATRLPNVAARDTLHERFATKPVLT